MNNKIRKKDFDVWSDRKKKIHESEENKLYHSRDIWWCSLGVNIGFEQDGTKVEKSRPVLILKGLSKNTCFVIPLTTSFKKHPMRIFLGEVDGKNASAIISQIRVIDTKRLFRKIKKLNKEKFEIIRKAVKDLI